MIFPSAGEMTPRSMAGTIRSGSLKNIRIKVLITTRQSVTRLNPRIAQIRLRKALKAING